MVKRKKTKHLYNRKRLQECRTFFNSIIATRSNRNSSESGSSLTFASNQSSLSHKNEVSPITTVSIQEISSGTISTITISPDPNCCNYQDHTRSTINYLYNDKYDSTDSSNWYGRDGVISSIKNGPNERTVHEDQKELREIWRTWGWSSKNWKLVSIKIKVT